MSSFQHTIFLENMDTTLKSILTTLKKNTTTESLSPQDISGTYDYSWNQVDISSIKNIGIYGTATDNSFNDLSGNHLLNIFVSDVSGGSFYKTTLGQNFSNGTIGFKIDNMPFKFIS